VCVCVCSGHHSSTIGRKGIFTFFPEGVQKELVRTRRELQAIQSKANLSKAKQSKISKDQERVQANTNGELVGTI